MHATATFRACLCAVLVAASGSLLTACDRNPSDPPRPTTGDDTVRPPAATPMPPASSPDGTATPPRSGTGTQ